mmetsp:Transcript_69439/g.166468  ORF Transcript_69439/g.166468 Transcript_69439/m.166468 type:complete len:186 (+) Transcript_69439:115-672(+)
MNWALLISVATCIGSWYYTWKYHVVTNHNMEATVFNTLYSEYSKAAMIDAFDMVEDFRDRLGTADYAYEYFRLKQQNEEEGKQLDHARRHIVRWYRKVKLFYSKGQISWERYGHVLPGVESARNFIELFEPMVLADRVGMRRRLSPVFDWYKEKYGINGTGFQPDKVRLGVVDELYERKLGTDDL